VARRIFGVISSGVQPECRRRYGTRVHEPGCLIYSLLKSRAKSGAYIVHEQYRDQAALDAHQKSAHGARYFPKMRAIIEKIEVEYFDGIVD